MNPAPPARPRRLERRVGALIAAQLLVAAGFGSVTLHRGDAFGPPWAVATLTLVFALTGFFDMSLELHRHRFTFTLAEAVLVVGFFAAGPLGLAVAAAAGEGIDMVVQRHAPLKVAFNVCNRLAATTAAAVAFVAIGHSDPRTASSWVAALGAALCFSVLDVVATAAVLSIVEETRFHNVFVRSAGTGLLATLTAAPVGIVALDLAAHGLLAPLLLVPIATAVALNARYAVAQRDEHLRFERLYESSARTTGIVAFDDALRSLATEIRSLGTGVAALCCATGGDGEWHGAYADDAGARGADPGAVERAVALAARAGDCEIDVAEAPEIGRLASPARSAVVVTAEHENGQVVLVVLRDGTSSHGARSRVETLETFAHNAALIVSNALLHEERALALARQVDLNRQKSDFVAAVSHELRTPLAVMLGSVHTLERLEDRMTTEQRTQLFDMTIDQGGRLQRLIDELLLVAAAEHAAVPLETERIDVDALFATLAAASAPSAAGRLVCATRGAPAIVSDRSKVERIVGNLVENAAKYAPEGPIELHAASADDSVRLSVADHGPGIPAVDRDRVFERFVQLDQSSTRRQGGTGLGLHLCRQLAGVIDGRIELTETPGGGCTFTLVLPRVLRRAAEAPAPERAGVATGGSGPTGFDANAFGNVRARPGAAVPAREAAP